jgi:hypothetical protein
MTLMHKEGKDNRLIRAKYNISNDTFIIDSGATSHMRFSKKGMMNLRDWNLPIKVGNSEDMYSEMIGTFVGKVVQQDVIIFDVTLEAVLYVPDLYMNVLSLTKILNNPHVDLKKEQGTITVTYNAKFKLLIDKKIIVGKGNLLGIEIVPK